MIRRAMVMAAGKGLERPLTNDRPKPLVEVAGKTLIDHALDRLVAAKVELAVINLHYKSEMLAPIWLSAATSRSVIPRKKRHCSIQAAGWSKRCPISRRAFLHPQFGFHLGGRL